MADSLRRIKDFLILGNYLRHCEIKTQFQFGQNGLKLRENLLRNHQKSLASTNSQNYLIHSNSPCVNSDILNEQLSCPEKTKLFYAWKEQAAEEPLSFFHLPLTDKTSVFETLKAENFGATSFTFLSSFNDRWNFSFQDFLRSRRQFWKRLFFDPGTNLHAAENDSTGTKPSAIIEATFSDFEDFSSNLTVESVRLLDKSEIPKVFEKEAGSVRMVESKTYLSSGTLAILLGSVRKRLYLPTTRLGSHNTVKKELKPSLRRDKIDYSTEDVNALKVTPEFKKFVAAKLSEIIDKSYKTKKKKKSSIDVEKTPTKDIETNVEGIEEDGGGGVKLFSKSKKFLAPEEPKEVMIKQTKPDLLAHRKKKKKKEKPKVSPTERPTDEKSSTELIDCSTKLVKSAKDSDSSDSSDDEARFRESAVSPEWVLDRKGVYESSTTT